MKADTPITWFETIDSTNNEAKRQISTLPANVKMSVYAARYQTAGRGQRGNRWDSKSGENLTFSILLNLDGYGLNARDQFMLSIVSALSVSDFLLRHDIENRIKWPNDIYIGNKKVCGMLIENSINKDTVNWSIVGIGLNLNQTEFPPQLVNPTSLLLSGGARLEPEQALKDFVAIFKEKLEQLLEGNDSGRLRDEYTDRLYRRGLQCQFYDCIENQEITGKIKGISDEGLLLMEMPDMSMRKYAFKEVSYII